MKRLLNLNVAPPGGWRFVDPETGYLYERGYKNVHELVSHIRSYRAENKLTPIPNLYSVVSDWLCTQPGMNMKCAARPFQRSFSQYRSGLKAAIKVKRKGEDAFTSQQVAEKRALICVRCRFNEINPRHTLLQRYTDKYVSSLVGNRKTLLDGKLYSCSVCTCPLRPKVHFSNDIIESSLIPEERVRLPNGTPGLDKEPLFCWQIVPVTG